MKTRKQIYLGAARSVAEGKEQYSCLAIARQHADYERFDAVQEYLGMFAADAREGFMTDILRSGHPRHLRVMLLCFMAAMS